jgi:hypothetical protein
MSLIRNWLTGIKIGEEIGAMSATDLVRPKINKSWNRRSILPNLTTKFGRQLGKIREAEEVIGVLFRYRDWFVTNNFIVSGLKMLLGLWSLCRCCLGSKMNMKEKIITTD